MIPKRRNAPGSNLPSWPIPVRHSAHSQFVPGIDNSDDLQIQSWHFCTGTRSPVRPVAEDIPRGFDESCRHPTPYQDDWNPIISDKKIHEHGSHLSTRNLVQSHGFRLCGGPSHRLSSRPTAHCDHLTSSPRDSFLCNIGKICVASPSPALR